MPTYDSVADLVQEAEPYIGQDHRLVYRVRTNRLMTDDEVITGWALTWSLFDDEGDAAARLLKTTAGATITIATPYATVILTAANMAALIAGTRYRMQLWRTDSGNTYPLTGLGVFIPQSAAPLV